jgi:hypothetical protein
MIPLILLAIGLVAMAVIRPPYALWIIGAFVLAMLGLEVGFLTETKDCFYATRQDAFTGMNHSSSEIKTFCWRTRYLFPL